jgi:hypothetical protein
VAGARGFIDDVILPPRNAQTHLPLVGHVAMQN